MAFPLAGVYYIRHVVDGANIFANTVGPEQFLFGTDVMVSRWRLEYIESYAGENERACILSHEVEDVVEGYLGAAALENNEHVRRVLRPQIWYLAVQEGGFRIYQLLNDVEVPFALRFNEAGPLITEITLSNADLQSWQFQPVE